MNYRSILTTILLVAVVPLSGCAAIGIGWPTREFGLVSGKGMISDETIATLSHSDTTLEQALLTLGAPSRTIEENENIILVYDWQTNQNFGASAGGFVVPTPVAAGGGAGVASGYGVASHVVLLEFDKRRTLTRLDHIKFYDDFTLPQEDIEHWASGYSLCSNVYETSGTKVTAYCLDRFAKGE